MKKSPRFRSQLCTHGFGGSVWSFGELMGSIVRGTQGGNAPFFVVKKTWSEVLFWHFLWKNWSEVKGNVIETMWMRVQFLVMQFLMFWSCCFLILGRCSSLFSEIIVLPTLKSEASYQYSQAWGMCSSVWWISLRVGILKVSRWTLWYDKIRENRFPTIMILQLRNSKNKNVASKQNELCCFGFSLVLRGFWSQVHFQQKAAKFIICKDWWWSLWCGSARCSTFLSSWLTILGQQKNKTKKRDDLGRDVELDGVVDSVLGIWILLIMAFVFFQAWLELMNVEEWG